MPPCAGRPASHPHKGDEVRRCERCRWPWVPVLKWPRETVLQHSRCFSTPPQMKSTVGSLVHKREHGETPPPKKGSFLQVQKVSVSSHACGRSGQKKSNAVVIMSDLFATPDIAVRTARRIGACAASDSFANASGGGEGGPDLASGLAASRSTLLCRPTGSTAGGYDSCSASAYNGAG